MHRIWTEQEKEYIRQNAHLFKDVELLDKLRMLTGKKMALQSLRKQRQKMGIYKKNGRGLCVAYNKKTLQTVPISKTVSNVEVATTEGESIV
jgi:hypothetical protein